MFASALLCVCGFASCDDSKDPDTENTLSVAPSSAIEFKASGNEDVVLKVTTDAGEWSYTAPDWVEAAKEGAELKVNAKDNTTGSMRVGRIEFKAGNAKAVYVGVSQNIPADGDDNVLTVEPSDAITFEAEGNADVVLTVTTDAAEWAFEAPEWVKATKDGDKLTVNAEDNTSNDQRVGRLTVTAGTARPNNIAITQKGKGDAPADKVAGSLATADELAITIEPDDATIAKTVKVSLASAAAAAAEFEVFIDEEYVAEYNFINESECVLFPTKFVTLAGEGKANIAAGATASDDLAVTFAVESDEIVYNTDYLVPLCLRAKSGNVSVPDEGMRVNFVLRRKAQKEVRNVLYFEVNNTNPLNALEYVLEDGQMFFDAVILFAANINYNSSEDRVFLSNNPNVQALLDETDVYLQPLRKKGIKVYLGLLGNHDQSGLCQLSDWGAAEWSKEVALAVKNYKLDGVNLDDEYSNYPDTSNKWFTSKSAYAGARLCYELKKEMKRICDWETEVSVFMYGSLYSIPDVTDQDDQTVHRAGEFVDFWVANYGGRTTPYNDSMTMKQCCGMSIECNLGSGWIDESSARQIKEDGYGWVMWFAFDPAKTGQTLNNYGRSFSKMQAAARGLYDQELLVPTGYYEKKGEGEYNPNRIESQF